MQNQNYETKSTKKTNIAAYVGKCAKVHNMQICEINKLCNPGVDCFKQVNNQQNLAETTYIGFV